MDRDRKTTPTYAEAAEEDTRPGSPQAKRRSSASQLKAVVCARCAEYRQRLAKAESNAEREAHFRLIAEQRAKALHEELAELKRGLI